METNELKKRYASAVCDLNNWHTGRYELTNPIEIGWDMELRTINLDDDSIVEIAPKSRFYVGHSFIIDLDSLSDDILRRLCEELEDAINETVAWWDRIEDTQ